jgi:hypothetical protein
MCQVRHPSVAHVKNRGLNTSLELLIADYKETKWP